jgi:hypothetical protein
MHGCSISPSWTGRSFQRRNAAQPKTDRSIGLGLYASLPITARFQ